MKVAQQIELAGHNPNRKMWDRRPDETPMAWANFQLFLGMGIERTTYKVAKERGKNQKYIYDLSTKFDWHLRAAAWDQRLADIKNAAIEDEVRLMGIRQARSGVRLQEVGMKRVEEFDTRLELRESMTARDAIAMVKEGAAIERTARGEDTGKSDGQTIVFNFNMPAPPKWAPKPTAVPPAAPPPLLPAEIVEDTLNGQSKNQS